MNKHQQRYTGNELIERAEGGDPDAQYCLGNAFYSGDICAEGESDYVEAAFWYRRAAEQQHSLATYQLGVMCYWGLLRRQRGEPINYKDAADWFSTAANLMIRENTKT